ncbi:MAG: diguanylate cyclase response regulator, partial [Nitrospiraceae bacterium]
MNEGIKHNILIVDDRNENLLTLESLLEGPDRNIIRALSGNEALALTLEHDFAL